MNPQSTTRMHTSDEVIALLLDDADGVRGDAIDLATTTCLVRGSDGHIRLQRPESQEALERTAETTGVFKRGAPIVDPASGDVIGYEMEEITELRAAAR